LIIAKDVESGATSSVSNAPSALTIESILRGMRFVSAQHTANSLLPYEDEMSVEAIALPESLQEGNSNMCSIGYFIDYKGCRYLIKGVYSVAGQGIDNLKSWPTGSQQRSIEDAQRIMCQSI
jgi:hypothetical protein